MEEFEANKGNWLLYRSMGHINENGTFVPPLSYLDAQQMPKRTVELFLMFDDYADKTLKQMNKNKGK